MTQDSSLVSWNVLALAGHPLAAHNDDEYEYYKDNSGDDADQSWIHGGALLTQVYAAQVSPRFQPRVTDSRYGNRSENAL